MMQTLIELVRNLIVIVLLASFLELFTPRGELDRWIRLALGLVIVAALVTPVVRWLSSEDWWTQLPESLTASTGGGEEYLQQGEMLNQLLQEEAWHEYEQELNRQVAAVAALHAGVAKVAVESELGATGELQSLHVYLWLEEGVEDAGQLAAKVSDVLSGFWPVAEGNIVCQIVEGEESRDDGS